MPNMQLQTLPIGEQSFEKLRRENRLYVDKTEYVYRMALQQIHDKEYDLPWRIENREKVLIGVNFSTAKRRPDDWIVERSDGTVVESEKKNVTQDVTQDVTGVTGRSKKKERLENVLKTLLANRQMPQDEIAKLLGVSRRTIIRDFNALRLTYRIEWIGNAWEGYWEIEKLS